MEGYSIDSWVSKLVSCSFSLPQSAADHRQWWENSRRHVQALGGWLSLGWVVSSVDLKQKSVTFHRNNAVESLDVKQGEISAIQVRTRNFETRAQKTMNAYFGKPLRQRKQEGWAKLFDLVSDDYQIVGDAKCLTMVTGKGFLAAKFAIIAEHVWMLEKTLAAKKFLVFGIERRVAEEWLKRYGRLVDSVKFYFIAEDESVEQLN